MNMLKGIEEMNYHKKMSYLKSGIRIVGFLCLMFGAYFGAGIVLIVAEILGILEEKEE